MANPCTVEAIFRYPLVLTKQFLVLPNSLVAHSNPHLPPPFSGCLVGLVERLRGWIGGEADGSFCFYVTFGFQSKEVCSGDWHLNLPLIGRTSGMCPGRKSARGWQELGIWGTLRLVEASSDLYESAKEISPPFNLLAQEGRSLGKLGAWALLRISF